MREEPCSLRIVIWKFGMSGTKFLVYEVEL